MKKKRKVKIRRGQTPSLLRKSHAHVPKNKVEHRKRKHKGKEWDEEK